MGILDFVPIIGKVLDSIFPDPAVAADAKLKVMQMAQTGDLAELNAELAQITGQLDTNKVEAANTNIFVAGWRPFIGWTCGSALAYKFVLAPFLTFLFAAFGHPIILPNLDFTEMNTVLLGMLGLGGMRTLEKIKGVA